MTLKFKFLPFFLGMLLVTTSAFAENPNPPSSAPTTPSIILEKAKKGRFEFYDTMLELKDYFQTVKKKEEIISFMLILEPLEKIEKELKFSIYETSPLADTASVMSVIAIGYSDISQDNFDFLKSIVKWFPDEKATVFFKAQKKIINSLSSKERLDFAFNRMVEIVQLLSGTLIDDKPTNSDKIQRADFIKEEASLLQGAILDTIQNRFGKNMPVSEFQKYLDQIKNPLALDFIIKSLSYQALAGNILTDLTHLLRFAHPLWVKERALQGENVLEQENPVGDMALKVISKLLFNVDELETDLLEKSISIFNAQQVVSLTSYLIQTQPETYPSSKIPLVAHIGKLLVPRCLQYNLTYEAQTLNTLLDRINLSAVLNTKKIEGIFQIKTPNGDKGILTVIKYGLSSMSASINFFDATINCIYAHYKPATDEFEFSSLLSNSSQESNTSENYYRIILHFKNNKKEVEGSYQTVMGLNPFQGIQIKEIKNKNPSSTSKLQKLEIEGTYSGTIKETHQEGRKIMLNINRQSNNSYVGNLSFYLDDNIGATRVQLITSYVDNKTGLIYLTEKAPPIGLPVLQLRGVVVDNTFYGQYIISGRSEILNVVMQKNRSLSIKTHIKTK